MKYKLGLIITISTLFAFYAYGGGDPDFVKFPRDYEASFAHYATMNRAEQQQVAKMYANDTAISSYEKDQKAAPGSIIVMEVYQPKKDAEGNPIVGDDGVYEIDKLAAVAVMEKRDDWPAEYPSENRLDNWGFALYNPDGTPKSNDLDCVGCHASLTNQDFLFSYTELIDHVKRQ